MSYFDEISGNPAIIGRGRTVVGESGQAIRNSRSVLVEDQAYTKWRRQFLPIPTVSLAAAGGEDVAQVQPQRLFKGKKISLSAYDPATGNPVVGTKILSIKIGQNEQFVSDGEIPIEAFDPGAVSSFVDLDDANVGNVVTVRFRNDHPTANAEVGGAVFGLIVE